MSWHFDPVCFAIGFLVGAYGSCRFVLPSGIALARHSVPFEMKGMH